MDNPVDGAALLLHFWNDGAEQHLTARYTSWRNGVGDGEVAVGDATVRFTDTWSVDGDVLTLRRQVAVHGDAGGGFATEVRLGTAGSLAASRLFLPGTQYGAPDRANPRAIAGSVARAAGDAVAYIREDRLPAPVAGVLTERGATLAVLDARPDGRTSAQDAVDAEAVLLVDAALRFGSLSVADAGGRVELGYAFPGLEGATTYRGDTFPDGQLRAWRRRYHPLADGLTQDYTVQWRRGSAEEWPAFVRDTWRWAWDRLDPACAYQDLDAARRALFDQLAGTVLQVDDRAGFPHFRDAVTGRPHEPAHRQANHALMGFTGRSTDCAHYLLREAYRIRAAEPERAERFERLATAVLDSFARMPYSPPEGEGFDIETGAIVPAAPHQARNDVMLLRGLAEGAKSMFRAWGVARAAGDEHPLWEKWARGLTDWLLATQRDDGSLPRAWVLGSSEVADGSGYSSYNAIALFVEAHRATGDERYRAAAIAAGRYVWEAGQKLGVYVGGTLDNPDVVDKEAGTLSLDGFLALHEATGDAAWLGAARAAADYAETWIYLWNVPMPEGQPPGAGWKRGVPTVGAQLIASGHSLVDEYMAFDAGNYAKLGALTGDAHYTDVARILLHNTKAMLALPGRTFDLAGPGWQQEHWSFAPVRGEGLHRGWLPWATCSHLEGMAVLEDFDGRLYRDLASPASASQ